jgi:hypothetical protein
VKHLSALVVLLLGPALSVGANERPVSETQAKPHAPENSVFQESGSELILRVDYEAGQLSSDNEVVADLPPAKDAISISDQEARGGKFCVRTKVANSADYISHGKHRAETTVMKLRSVRYNEDDVFRYRFSLRLSDDWQIEGKLPDDRDSVDIIWQFKRFEGGPDMFIGVKREEIVIRTASGSQSTLFGKYTPGKWMDFCVISRWSAGPNGFTEVFTKLASEREFRKAASLYGPNMRNAMRNNAYLTWGIYKPGMSNSTITNPRVVFHDDIIVEKIVGNKSLSPGPKLQ